MYCSKVSRSTPLALMLCSTKAAASARVDSGELLQDAVSHQVGIAGDIAAQTSNGASCDHGDAHLRNEHGVANSPSRDNHNTVAIVKYAAAQLLSACSANMMSETRLRVAYSSVRT